MRREQWRVMRGSKQFYVRTFRLAENTLVFSLLMNVLLGCAIYHVHFNKPERHFYVTNGVVPPTELSSMDTPNEGAEPLLANDPDAKDDEKTWNLE